MYTPIERREICACIKKCRIGPRSTTKFFLQQGIFFNKTVKQISNMLGSLTIVPFIRINSLHIFFGNSNADVYMKCKQ